MKNLMKKGFTLIELIVVIVIVAILSAGAYFGMQGDVKNAEFATKFDTVGTQARMVQAKFAKNFAIANTAGTKTAQYVTIDSTVTATTQDQATVQEIVNDAWASEVQVDAVAVCGLTAPATAINTALGIDANTTELSGLVVYVDGTDTLLCNDTTTADVSAIEGASVVYYNKALVGESDDYDSEALKDGGTTSAYPTVSRTIDLGTVGTNGIKL